MSSLSNRDVAGEEIKELLADFRNKRALGLGSLFGDHQLEGTMCIIFFASIYWQIQILHVEVVHWTLMISLFWLSDDNMDKGKELQVVEQTLMPHLEGVL